VFGICYKIQNNSRRDRQSLGVVNTGSKGINKYRECCSCVRIIIVLQRYTKLESRINAHYYLKVFYNTHTNTYIHIIAAIIVIVITWPLYTVHSKKHIIEIHISVYYQKIFAVIFVFILFCSSVIYVPLMCVSKTAYKMARTIHIFQCIIGITIYHYKVKQSNIYLNAYFYSKYIFLIQQQNETKLYFYLF